MQEETDKKFSLTSDQLARGSRTIALPGVGVAGQQRISDARVVVIGAGGLGSPILQYLAAAGVGVLGIVDDDVVDLSNLQRQVIHRDAAIGEPKSTSAAAAVRGINPHVEPVEHALRLDASNAYDLLAGYDVIVDASDNFATRYLVSDCAALLRRPYVWGSVQQFDGQVSVFWEAAPGDAALDFRDLYPVPPDARLVLSCADGGVLGSLCGTIGTMMATEVIKLVAGLGKPLFGRVQNLDALTGEWREFSVRRAPDRRPVTGLIDYDVFCGAGEPEPPDQEISVTELPAALDGGATLVDVREPWEHERGHIPGDRLQPLAALIADPASVGPGPIVFYCASGARSARAVDAARAVGLSAVSLRGGFSAWERARASN